MLAVNMETPVLISVISSATALVVAILSIIFNSHNQRRTAFKVEKLKLSIEIEKKTKEEALKLKNEMIDAINSALEYTQKIKDNILVLLNYLRFESKLTNDWLEKTREEIHNYSDLFSKVFPKLNTEEQTFLHDLKKDLYQVDYTIAKILHESKPEKQFDAKALTESLLKTRLRISEIQQSLLVRKVLQQNT